MRKVNIRVIGCDDETEFQMRLSDEALVVVKRLEKRCNDTSHGGCQPVIEIRDA